MTVFDWHISRAEGWAALKFEEHIFASSFSEMPKWMAFQTKINEIHAGLESHVPNQNLNDKWSLSSSIFLKYNFNCIENGPLVESACVPGCMGLGTTNVCVYIYRKNIWLIFAFRYVPKFKNGTAEADVYRTRSQTGAFPCARMRRAMYGGSSVMCAKLNKANWDVSYAFV